MQVFRYCCMLLVLVNYGHMTTTHHIPYMLVGGAR